MVGGVDRNDPRAVGCGGRGHGGGPVATDPRTDLPGPRVCCRTLRSRSVAGRRFGLHHAGGFAGLRKGEGHHSLRPLYGRPCGPGSGGGAGARRGRGSARDRRLPVVRGRHTAVGLHQHRKGVAAQYPRRLLVAPPQKRHIQQTRRRRRRVHHDVCQDLPRRQPGRVGEFRRQGPLRPGPGNPRGDPADRR